MEVTSEPSSFELLILIGGVISAILTIWKVMRMIKRASRKITEGIESISNLFNLMQQEYNQNGGKSHKDSLHKILEKEEILIQSHAELVSMLHSLLEFLKEERNKTS